jgi:hypothetical protein
MNRHGLSRLAVPWRMVGLALLLVAYTTFLVLAGGGGSMCAPSPGRTGPPQVNWTPLLQAVAPAVVTFFVLAYFALGIGSRWRRIIALVGTLAIAYGVAAIGVLFMPFSC